MPDDVHGEPPVSPAETVPTTSASDDKKKKKNKVRSAWISFVGRIVAQIVGAVASIALGLLVLRNYQTSRPASDATEAISRSSVPRSPGVVALAVLPLANFSGDAQQEYVADGMTEALIADLAQIDGLRVISRTSSMSYKGERKPLLEVAKELGVDLIVEGSVAKAGDRIRVTAQLIDAKRDEHIWARSYEHTVRDILTLQGEVATAIAKEVKGALTPGQQSRLSQRGALEPATYDLYLRGRHAWNLRTSAGLRDAVRFFELAIQQDPEFALAYAGLADAYGLADAGNAGGAEPGQAKAAATRALELDDGLAEAHTSLAAVFHRGEANREAAEREFRRALDLNPGYATAHQWYAIFLAEAGRDDDATRHAAQAVVLDPLSGPMHQTLGLVHYYGRRHDLAVAEARRAVELAPQLGLARQILAQAYVEQGQFLEAIHASEPLTVPLAPDMLAVVGIAHVRAGDRARGEAIRAELLGREPVPAGALARFYAGTGDPTGALDMLGRAIAAGPRSYQPLMRDPVFDALRSERRFSDLLRRAKLQ
jgi:TolB-like protein/Tfp pilus assembly protein PilF